MEKQIETLEFLPDVKAPTAKRRLNYERVAGIAIVHGFAVHALFFFPTVVDLGMFFGFYLLSGLGVTIGYHRLLTHRGFECAYPVKVFWVLCGATAFEGGPVTWVGVHRKHHATSDTENDPHSPIPDFLHAHAGWLLFKNDLPRTAVMARDVAQDKLFKTLDRFPFSLLPWLFTLAICYAIGGYAGVLWGGALRTVVSWHATWSVNSFCHRWGYQNYDTKDESRNLWWVAIFALGEGWHNNHHYRPRAAVHGHRRHEFDISGAVILLMEKIGLARDVVIHKSQKDQTK